MKYIYRKGFTLIELLVVIAIIAILALVVIVNYDDARSKAKTSKKAADLDQLAKAISLYYENTNSLPLNRNTVTGNFARWCYVGVNYTDTTNPGVCLDEVKSGGYLPSLPMGYKNTCDDSTYDSNNPECYYYYNYGSMKAVMVATKMDPPEYGPFPYGWHCSEEVGKGLWTGMEEWNGPGASIDESYYRYCDGFLTK